MGLNKEEAHGDSIRRRHMGLNKEEAHGTQ